MIDLYLIVNINLAVRDTQLFLIPGLVRVGWDTVAYIMYTVYGTPYLHILYNL